MTRIASAQKSLCCSLERETSTGYKIKDSLHYGYVALMSTMRRSGKYPGQMKRTIHRIVRWEVNWQTFISVNVLTWIWEPINCFSMTVPLMQGGLYIPDNMNGTPWRYAMWGVAPLIVKTVGPSKGPKWLWFSNPKVAALCQGHIGELLLGGGEEKVKRPRSEQLSVTTLPSNVCINAPFPSLHWLWKLSM